MPMPSPLRLLAYALAAILIPVAVFFVIQGAVMLYDLYEFLQWVEEYGE